MPQLRHGHMSTRGLHIVEWGKGDPVIMVHGSFGWGEDTFGEQKPLSHRYRLMLVDRRGFGNSPPTDRVDFDSDADDVAEILGEGAHLVGHSYGGVVSLLAAARRPAAVRSLTVIEPPAFMVAMPDPVVATAIEEARTVMETGTKTTPQQFYANFMGTTVDRLPPLSEKDLRAIRSSMTERPPYEAVIPMEEIARASYTKLVVSGQRQRKGRGEAFIKICDTLERKLGARRVTIEGATHNPQISHSEKFNAELLDFLNST